MAEKKYIKKFLKFRRKYQDVGGLKTPQLPCILEPADIGRIANKQMPTKALCRRTEPSQTSDGQVQIIGNIKTATFP